MCELVAAVSHVAEEAAEVFREMWASLLSCHWTLEHLDHRAEERKMSYGRILERNKRKMEKRRFPFLRAVNPRVPKRVWGVG